MSTHTATVAWQRQAAAFTDQKYSRAHDWRFDGGAVVRGSSSPLSVRAPYSDPAAVDPEEALVAAVSSCHMLWFLSLAAHDGYLIDSYTDEAAGTMAKNDQGRMAITEVVLRPLIVFSGAKAASQAVLDDLHHRAHEACFIANSIRGEVRVEGRWEHAG